MNATRTLHSLFALASLSTVFALPAAASIRPELPNGLPVSVTQARAQLQKTKDTGVGNKINRTEKALKTGAVAVSLQTALSIKNDPSLGDIGSLLAARALQAQAVESLRNKNYRGALVQATQSIARLHEVEDTQPYAPELKRQPEEIARAELLQAKAHQGLKKLPLAMGNYLRAFARLSAANELGALRPEVIEDFVEICLQTKHALCSPWAQRLSSAFPKISSEIKALNKKGTELSLKPKSPGGISRLTQSYKAPDADQVAWDDAWSKYLAGKPGNAVPLFQKFLDEFPKSTHRFRARYWLARALQADDKKERAQAAFEDVARESPLSLHGLLANQALARPFTTGLDENPPLAVPADGQLSAAELVHLHRAERLLREGAPSWAAAELHELHPRDALGSPFLFYLSMLDDETGYHLGAFSVITDLIQRGTPGVFSQVITQYIFPIAQWEPIQKYARQQGVDPVLVLSLVKQESAFESRAGSGAGAQGLMQLMPATAVETDASVLRSDLAEPDTSLRVGTRYLKQLLDRNGGNIALALASYNAGPNAVDRWLRDTPPKEKGWLEFIESIPYRETRDYVGSIIRNYYWYSWRLGLEPPNTPDFFWKSNWGSAASANSATSVAASRTSPSAVPSPIPSSPAESSE